MIKRDYLKNKKNKRNLANRFSGVDLSSDTTKKFISTEPDIKKTDKDILGAGEGDGKVNYICTNDVHNTILFSSMRDGTNTCYVVPKMHQAIKRGESIVITSERMNMYLFEPIKELAKKSGYNVKVLDPSCCGAATSDCFDIFSNLNGGLKARDLAEAIIKATNSDSKKIDVFWKQAEIEILTALFGYIENEAEDKSITYAYKFLASYEPEDIMECISKYAFTPENIALPERTLKSIIISLCIRLNSLIIPDIKEITTKPDIDLTLPAKEKCIYFILVSDIDMKVNSISKVFISILIDALMNEKEHKVKINYIFDEFQTLECVKDLEKYMTLSKSNNVSFSIVLRSINQLKEYNKRTWQTITDCCDVKIVFGFNDHDTADYFASIMGLKTDKTKYVGICTYKDNAIILINDLCLIRLQKICFEDNEIRPIGKIRFEDMPLLNIK